MDPQQPVAMPDPYQMPTQSSPSGKSHLGLWIGLGVGGALLLTGIIVGVVLLLMSGSPKSIASAYLSAIEQDNKAKIRELSGESADSLTDKARQEIKASKGFTYDSEKDNKDKGVVVRFKAGENKKTIIAVTVKDKRVTGLVVDNGKRAKVDDEKKDEDMQPAPQTQPAPTVSTCLSSGDLRSAGYSHINNGEMKLYNGKFNLDNTFFKADSAEYQYEITSNRITMLASLYKNNPGKKFTIEIQGSTYESGASAAGDALARQRFEKVKGDLVAQGIPGDIIAMAVSRRDTSSEAARNVTIFLVMDQSCSE